MRNPSAVVVSLTLALTALAVQGPANAGELITIEGTLIEATAVKELAGSGTTITTIGSLRVAASSARDLVGQLVQVRAPGGQVGDERLQVSHVPELRVGSLVRATAQRTADGLEIVSELNPVPDRDADERTAEYSTLGNGWDCARNLPIRFFHNETNAPPGARDAVNAGLATWENDAASWIDFEDAGVTTTSGPANDARQIITWRPIADAGVLARTWIWSTSARFVHVDMEFNTSYQWSTAPSVGEIDIESVALHEAGHALGLDHSSKRESIMYPTYSPGAIRRTLDVDDLAGVHALYPYDDLKATTASIDPPNVPLPMRSGQAFPVNQARYTFAVQVRNDGRTPWGRWGSNDVALRVVHVLAARDGVTVAGDSPFCDPSWVDCRTPATHVSPVVCRGESVWLEFTMRGPATRGTFRQRFAIVDANGTTLGAPFEWSNLIAV